MNKIFATLALTAVLSLSGVASAQSDAKQDVKEAGHATANETREAGHSVSRHTRRAYHKTKRGVKRAGRATKRAAEKTHDAVDPN